MVVVRFYSDPARPDGGTVPGAAYDERIGGYSLQIAQKLRICITYDSTIHCHRQPAPSLFAPD